MSSGLSELLSPDSEGTWSGSMSCKYDWTLRETRTTSWNWWQTDRQTAAPGLVVRVPHWRSLHWWGGLRAFTKQTVAWLLAEPGKVFVRPGGGGACCSGEQRRRQLCDGNEQQRCWTWCWLSLLSRWSSGFQDVCLVFSLVGKHYVDSFQWNRKRLKNWAEIL